MNQKKLEEKIIDALVGYEREIGMEVNWSDMEDIVSAFSMGVAQCVVDLMIAIELRCDSGGTDYWLQAEYYSRKIGKTIIFDYDFQDYFENAEEFAGVLSRAEDEVREFEKRLSIKNK